jgi:hypothetical protein
LSKARRKSGNPEAAGVDSPAPDRPFNPARVARSSKADKLVNDVIAQLEEYETHFGLRSRKRKVVDQWTFKATVTAIICDLAHFHLTGALGAIYVTRSNTELGSASRYRPRALNKKLPHILDLLAKPEMGMLEQKIGVEGDFGSQRRTTIKPSERLMRQLSMQLFDPADFATSDQHEIIQLKSAKDGFWGAGKLLEYDDDDATRRLRSQMSSINQWLNRSKISFDPIVLDRSDQEIDDSQRSLRRVFTQGTFASGGRLWGGFWYGLKGKERLNGISLNEEPIVELDFGQMSVRIVYGLKGAVPDFDDAYAIPDYADHRSGIKKVINSMLFAGERLRRMPQGVRKDMQRHHTIGAVMSAIEVAHEPIRTSFFSAIGHRAQRVESDILVAVLLALKDEGVPALPIHDAILVPQSASPLARTTMLSVFREYAGVDGVVKESTVADLLANGGAIGTGVVG